MKPCSALAALFLLLPLAAQEPEIVPPTRERPDRAERETRLTFSEEAARVLREFAQVRHDPLATGLDAFTLEVTLHVDRLPVGRIRAHYSWKAPKEEEITFPDGPGPLGPLLRQGLRGIWRDLLSDPLGETLEGGGHLSLTTEEGLVLLLERRERPVARLHFDPATRLLRRIESLTAPKAETRFTYERVQDKWALSGRELNASGADGQGLSLAYAGFRRLNQYAFPSVLRLVFRGVEQELHLEMLTLGGAPALAVVEDPKLIKEAVAAFQAGWAQWNPVEKVEQIGKLAALGGPEAALALASRLADPLPQVRMELASALGRMKEPRSVPPLLSALDRERGELPVFRALCRALGEIGDPRAVSPLARNIFSGNRREQEWQEQAFERIDAIGAIRHPAAVEELIALLAKAGGGRGGGGYGTFNQRIRRALRSLTGQDLRDHSEWRSWWKENRSTFRFP